jgi:hypothetical protein
MKSAQARVFANIASKPEATRRDTLIVTRRAVRSLCEQRQQIQDERNFMRRQAAKLRRFEPFTKRDADELGQQARHHRAIEMDSVHTSLLIFGRIIVLDTAGDAKTLGFDALADLLNINQTDREEARREGWRTLADLVAIHDLENSAEPRGNEWAAGSPLYQACQIALRDFIRTCPEHLLPSLSSPDKPQRSAVESSAGVTDLNRWRLNQLKAAVR